jgi:epoxyqueuosine reductase
VYAYDTLAASADADDPARGKIARTYVYYAVARRVGESVAGFLRQRGYQAVAGQDVPLKHLAVRLGLAQYGSNGILLTPRFGSYVALRSVITDAPLAATTDVCPDLCTRCGHCLSACPTGAIYEPGKVNPKLCLNPITRRPDPIAPATRLHLHNWARGCDICQEACPVNLALTPREPDPRAVFEPAHHDTHRGLGGVDRFPKLATILGPDRPDNLRRQAAIALANTAPDAAVAVAALGSHLDSCGPELYDYFLWAIGKLQQRSTP